MRILCTANIGGPNPSFAHTLKNVKLLSSSDVLHVFDAVEPEFLYKLLQEKGLPGYIVLDHFTSIQLENLICYCLPFWLERESLMFASEIQSPNTLETHHCFNFQINKKQINRFLCMKFIEYFELSDYNYTWSGVDINFNMADIIDEIQRLGNKNPVSQIEKLLGPITIPRRFVDFAESQSTDSQVINYGGNVWAWKNALESVVTHTAVSLITESVRFQKGAIFTEKTLYAVLGMTFPIWIGGYRQATEWKKMGFDTFEDVVDHSYENYDTLTERCYYAFERNLKILQDKDYVADLRKTHAERLQHNQKLIFKNAISKYIDSQIARCPPDLQAAVTQIRQQFISS